MEAWEKWCSIVTTGECGWKFPCLQKLEMLNCPVLVGECSVSLPSLRKLKLKKCNEAFLKCMIDIGSLTSLTVEGMPGLSCLQSSVGQLLVALEDNMTGLRSLKVRNCPELVSLMTRATISEMAYLEKMIVEECPGIRSIQIDHKQERNNEVKLPPKLKHLKLVNCGDLFMECLGNCVLMISDECVLVDYLEIKGCDNLQHLAIKSGRGGNKVKCMRIEDCTNLVSLSTSYEITVQEEDGMEELNDNIPRTSDVEIEELDILNCPSLTSDGLKSLVAVKRLELEICSQLQSVAEERVDQNHKMNMPWTTAEDITIKDCPNLKSFADRVHQWTTLTGLYLKCCDGLELFPERELPFPNLSSLRISQCQSLKSMPNNMQCLTTLTHLHVVDCGGLKSFPGEGSLPPNLTELAVMRCPNVKKQKMSEWKLDTLSSLTDLLTGDVGDGDFKDMLLPTTLRSLHIGKLPKLECISSSTCASSSSKCFHLHKNLTSLTYLGINDCPKLRCLPKEGLPPTLMILWVVNCPIIGKKCIEGTGKYWSRISLIPRTYVHESE